MSTDEIMQEIQILSILHGQLIEIERSIENSSSDETLKIHYTAYVEQNDRYKSQYKKIENIIRAKNE